jgi:hypothetical protein
LHTTFTPPPQKQQFARRQFIATPNRIHRILIINQRNNIEWRRYYAETLHATSPTQQQKQRQLKRPLEQTPHHTQPEA